MDIAHLRAFVTISRFGNLTRAARHLHLSQPAVSLQIKALQQQLRLQLFVRTAGGMVLTADGNRLLPLAQQVLDDMQRFAVQADALQASATALSGTLAIGTILDPEFIRLGPFLQSLVSRYPQLSTRLTHHMSGSVLQWLADGTLNVGFFLGEPGAGFHAIALTPFSYHVIAPSGWKPRVTGRGWKELSRLPWIWTPPESVHHRLLSPIFAQHNVQPNKVALVDQESSMLDLVKSGVGLSLARTSIALNQAHAHGLVIADAVELATELRFVCVEKRKHEHAIQAVLQLVRDVWRA